MLLVATIRAAVLFRRILVHEEPSIKVLTLPPLVDFHHWQTFARCKGSVFLVIQRGLLTLDLFRLFGADFDFLSEHFCNLFV